MLGSKCVMGIAGAPLRSSCELSVFIFTSYCACGHSVSQHWAAGGRTGHDSTSSASPWDAGVFLGCSMAAGEVGQLPCTNPCLHLPHSLGVSVTSSLSSLPLFTPAFSASCNQFADGAQGNGSFPLRNRVVDGAL